VIRKPATEQLDTAIAWLRSNEGDEGEAERCAAVADWIEAVEADAHLRNAARNAGVSVAALRKRLREQRAKS
jgi:hypothetical protein